MKTLNITLSDQIHEMLTKLKDRLGVANLNEAIEEIIRLQYEKEAST